MSSALSQNSPVILRLQAWSRERFPIVNFFTGAIIYLMTLVVGRSLISPDQVPLYWRDVFGALALVCQFVVLRVLDEHKDFEIDSINYPERPLQKGLITLKHLRLVGFAAGIFQLGYSLYCDGGIGSVTLAWAAMTAWTLMMAKEFFCRSWLKQHLILYAFSHMLVMPFVMFWVFKIVAPRISVEGAPLALIVLTLISGFVFEITRKSRGVEEERETLDSYSKVLGARGAGLVISILLLAVLFVQLYLLRQFSPRPPLFGDGLILAAFFGSCVSVWRYMVSPTIKARKINEGVTGLFMLINYVSIIVIVGMIHGIKFF